MKTPTCAECGGPIICLHCEPKHRAEKAAALRKVRQDAGLSLREVARELGISVVYLSEVERGFRRGYGVHERAMKIIERAK
jgi:DNA-binding transcriptional regulator YiaG